MIFVDGLRGLAAVAIVIVHSAEIFRATTRRNDSLADWLYTVRHYSLESVQIFFVLSGFVIAYTLRDTRLTPVALCRFLLRRSIRLDPPYWTSILISSLALCLLADRHQHAAALPAPRLILAHLLYLQDLLGFGEPINHIYWTLCVEFQMYLAFAGMICLLQAIGIPYRPVLSIGLILSLGWPLGWFSAPHVRNFLPKEYCFLAGAVAWWTIEQLIPRWLVLAAFGAFAATSLCEVGDYHIWVVYSLAISLVIAGRIDTLYTWLGAAPLQFLGAISYGLYLVHDPVILLTLPLQRHLGLTSNYGEFATLLFVFLISILTAYVVRITVELPSIRLSHRFKAPPPKVLAVTSLS
jgi:peptidoglycan/LPS O-acetylase OafA/YrhL